MQNRGFTLIEMAMVSLIIGILLGPLLMLYRNSLSSHQIEVTEENLRASSEAITEFAGLNLRYPCPASLWLGPEDPNYGVPDCRDGTGYSGFTAPSTPGDCHAGICRAFGRDADGDGSNDTILIGAVPVTVLNEGDPSGTPPSFRNSIFLPASNALDGWKQKLTYAVSESMTDSTTFSPYRGAIEIVDENGISLLDEPGIAHFVLVSHGDNGVGAYTNNGDLITSCTLGDIESPNCSQAGYYVSGLRSLADGFDYNDDIIKYMNYTASAIWTASSMVDGAIFNAPGGNVAIGVDDPGNQMLAIAGNLQALELHTPALCGQADDPDECYDPELIGGDVPKAAGGLKCDSGQFLTAIEDGEEVCAAPSVAMGTDTCPAGEVVVGISNLGNVRCCPVDAMGVLTCP
ncbi:MAG: type II secretion system protein [Micavibrio sp.]